MPYFTNTCEIGRVISLKINRFYPDTVEKKEYTVFKVYIKMSMGNNILPIGVKLVT